MAKLFWLQPDSSIVEFPLKAEQNIIGRTSRCDVRIKHPSISAEHAVIRVLPGSATVEDLAQAIKELFGMTNPIKIIGTRHGEKLYESLISREEMARANDMGRYYRIPADNRGLNYDKYFVEGEEAISSQEDYTSHNTVRLNVDEIKKKLMELKYI